MQLKCPFFNWANGVFIRNWCFTNYIFFTLAASTAKTAQTAAVHFKDAKRSHWNSNVTDGYFVRLPNACNTPSGTNWRDRDKWNIEDGVVDIVHGQQRPFSVGVKFLVVLRIKRTHRHTLEQWQQLDGMRVPLLPFRPFRSWGGILNYSTPTGRYESGDHQNEHIAWWHTELFCTFWKAPHLYMYVSELLSLCIDSRQRIFYAE